VSDFITRLRVEILPPSEVKGRQIYLVTEDFVYDSNLFGRITVPAGFKTDFASIPRFAWRYIDPEDPCILYASVVHDYLYSLAGKIGEVQFTRDLADRVLREAMELSGARADQRAIVYKLVSWFGGSHWDADQKAA
jgi:hypothetical protein